MSRAVGIVLAAGAGHRYGQPKATVLDPDGTSWLVRAVASLVDAGCSEVIAVLGAQSDVAREHLSGLRSVRAVLAPDWAEGVSASLRAGLAALPTAEDVDRAVITLVDLPDVSGAVVARVLAAAEGDTALARATYSGQPGHPVVVGRSHWLALAASASGDRGAGPYLSAFGAVEVECADLASGRDIDVPIAGAKSLS